MMVHRFNRIPKVGAQHYFRQFSTHLTKLSHKFKNTPLANGINVVTLSSNQPQAAVGVFVNSGSRFEKDPNFGASFLLKHLGFKSTSKRSSLRLIREIELLGAQYSVNVGREHISYTSELTSDKVSGIVPILADVSNPHVVHYEIKEALEAVTREIHEIESNPKTLLEELMHQEAYRNFGLGNSLHTPLYNLHNLTEQVLSDFISSTYSPKSMVLVGTGGIEHSELVSIAEKNFEITDKTATTSSTPKSVYVGGDVRVPSNGPTYLTLAFPGASLSTKEQYAYGILQYILGNSKSYSTEGPGKGLSGRLNNNLVSQHSWIQSASSFNLNYSDSGLFGVSVSAERGNAAKLAQVLIEELQKLNKIDEAEFQKASSLLKANTLLETETTGDLLQFFGRRALKGHFQSPQAILEEINSVTLDEVQSVAFKILKSKPTLVALGDVANLPVISNL